MNGLWVPPGSMDDLSPESNPRPLRRDHPMRRDHLCASDHCFHAMENTENLIFCCHCDGVFEKPTSLLIEEKSHGIGYNPTYVPFGEWAKDKPYYAERAKDLLKERRMKADGMEWC